MLASGVILGSHSANKLAVCATRGPRDLGVVMSMDTSNVEMACAASTVCVFVKFGQVQQGGRLRNCAVAVDLLQWQMSASAHVLATELVM